ncbi:hypothetical protein PIB30_030149 [Stylosanthes scabra]|uniref:Uncharacterized protein n=1 Tax=Stylosanthes scabra TaxID=79078 RepID=A0ABU6QAY0_9FABA|nr:hypothetical protein [Stylosanthes scabra]
MGRRESTAHKPAKTSVRKPARNSRKEPPLPLSQLPLQKWFTTNEFWESYLDTFSNFPVLKPRYLPEGLLLEDKYEVFWEVVDQQGLKPFLHMRERYYPRMMKVIATTLQLKDSLDDVGYGEFYLRFWIAGVTYTVTLDELASVWGLRSEGLRYKGGNNLPRKYTHWKGEDSQDILQISKIGGGKYSVGEMKIDYCLLHYMLSYLWLPRKGNHGVFTEEDAFILRDIGFEEYTELVYDIYYSGRPTLDMACCGPRGSVVDRKGKRNKAVVENAPSQSGTSLDSQITPELMEMFAEKMHAFGLDWDKKMERVDKRLKVVEGCIASQAEGLQFLEEGMNTHFSWKAQSGI